MTLTALSSFEFAFEPPIKNVKDRVLPCWLRWKRSTNQAIEGYLGNPGRHPTGTVEERVSRFSVDVRFANSKKEKRKPKEHPADATSNHHIHVVDPTWDPNFHAMELSRWFASATDRVSRSNSYYVGSTCGVRKSCIVKQPQQPSIPHLGMAGGITMDSGFTSRFVMIKWLFQANLLTPICRLKFLARKLKPSWDRKSHAPALQKTLFTLSFCKVIHFNTTCVLVFCIFIIRLFGFQKLEGLCTSLPLCWTQDHMMSIYQQPSERYLLKFGRNITVVPSHPKSGVTTIPPWTR